MGCDSFSEFKVYFKQYQESLQLSPRSYDGSEIRDFFKRNDTPEFQAQVEKMANVLQSAKVVIFVGIGNSAMTAQYAARYFANSGKFSVCIVDPFNQIGVDSRCKKVEAIPGVKGTIRQGGQFQVIIGNDVPAVYDEVCALIGQTPVAQIEDDAPKSEKSRISAA